MRKCNGGRVHNEKKSDRVTVDHEKKGDKVRVDNRFDFVVNSL